MINRTFRLRLTVFYTLVVVGIVTSFAVGIYLQYRYSLSKTIDSYLMREANEEILFEVDPKLPSKNTEVIKRFGDEYFEVLDNHGQVVITSLNAKNQRWPLDKELMARTFKGVPQFSSINFRGVNYRVLYFPISGEKILRIALSLREIDESMKSLRGLFFLFLPLIIVISSGASWFLSGKALAPVVKIRELAGQVRDGRLGKRIEMEAKGKEIEDLVRMFNGMLDGIQESVEAQKRFTAAVSHEVRSPLTSLRGSIEVALRKTRTPEEYEDLLKTNLSDIVRLSKITDNLLFFSKADNNIIELKKQWFDVSHLLETIVERMRYKATSAGITIAESYGEGIEMNGDIDLLEQAFSNIIDNALKYTPSGGTVDVTVKSENGRIVVAVLDTGIGIPESEVSQIFERFYRVSKERSRKLGGTGLGLSIAQWVIQAHEGRIDVKSAVGAGSEFVTSFPVPAD
ncbi:MAG: ATP-binding protein [Nitrospiraceae bacterium]|nr:ATP-binding protein [Nitrospiraceae bacterium]